jgi:lipopolysaccharide transport system permease protein
MSFAQYFRLVDIQARMLLKADASKYTLGFLWWLIEPMLYVVIFYVVFNIVLDSNRGDFLPFLMTGKFAFIWFSKTVLQASGSIVGNKSLVGKIDVPKTLFPMAAIQESLYRQVVVYLLLFCTLVIFDYQMTLTWFWLIPVIFVYYLVIVAASFIGSFLVCMVRDFSKAIPLGMMFLLFTSGIFWDVRDIPNEEKMNLVLTLNPIAFILDAHRQLLMYDSPPDVVHLLLLGLVAGAVIAVMVGLMRRYNQYIAYKVLTS